MSRAALLLALALLLPSAAHGQEYGPRTLAFQGLGASLFQVLPARSEAATGVQINGHLGRITRRVRIVPSLTFWATRLRSDEVSVLRNRVEGLCEAAGTPCPGLELGEVQLSDLSLDLDAHYTVRGPLGLEPYAGFGAGLHLVNGGGEFIDNTFVEEILDAITPGMNGIAGVELPLPRGFRLRAEARAVVAGGANWIGAGIGGSFVLPRRRGAATEGRP
ncbi:MAG: hypothetical protein ICV87_02625 [Gemmatimonadetes bacterium]|nr:hypothetical protein [Gemmatimonadota bacterium]